MRNGKLVYPCYLADGPMAMKIMGEGGYECSWCHGIQGELRVYHLDGDVSNCGERNLAALCMLCAFTLSPCIMKWQRRRRQKKPVLLMQPFLTGFGL